MREVALATGVNNKEIIDFLYTNIKSKIDFCKTILTSYCDNNFAYLLFACEDTYMQACETIIKDILIDYIENIYKLNYLKNKIKYPINDTLAFNAYIKVLSVFDKTTDKMALEKIILFNQTFFIDSFLEFRLAPLKRHWDNIADLSTDNLTLFNSSTFIDVIRFLINTMDNMVYKVKVIIDGENFRVYNMQNKNAKVKKIAECNNSIDLISNVFDFCPNYIDVYLNTEQDCEAVSFLSNVFANRLKIYSKN